MKRTVIIWSLNECRFFGAATAVHSGVRYTSAGKTEKEALENILRIDPTLQPSPEIEIVRIESLIFKRNGVVGLDPKAPKISFQEIGGACWNSS